MFRGFRRCFASDPKAPVQLVPKPRSRASKWGRRIVAATGVAASLYLFDIWVNDDWEIITDRFRRTLSEEERKDRPRVVILGSGPLPPRVACSCAFPPFLGPIVFVSCHTSS